MPELIEYLEHAVEEFIDERTQKTRGAKPPYVFGSYIVFGKTCLNTTHLFSEYIETQTIPAFTQINRLNELLVILNDIQKEAEAKRDQLRKTIPIETTG